MVEDLTRRFNTTERHYAWNLLYRNSCGHKVSHAHQIVGRARERKHPVHLQGSAMTYLAQQSHRLQPTEAFFDTLPFFLTDGHSPRGAWFADRWRCRLFVSDFAPRAASRPYSGTRAQNPLYRSLCRRPPSRTRYPEVALTSPLPHPSRRCLWPPTLSSTTINPVAILHQQISAITQLGLLACAFCVPAVRPDRSSIRCVRFEGASPHENSLWDFPDHLAETHPPLFLSMG